MKKYSVVILLCLILEACQSSPKVVTDRNGKENLEVSPKITKPIVRKIWIPEKIEDDGQTMIGGHWKYFIERGSSWAN